MLLCSTRRRGDSQEVARQLKTRTAKTQTKIAYAASLHLTRGYEYDTHADYARALADYRAYLSENRNDPVIAFRAASRAIDLGQWADARPLFRVALRYGTPQLRKAAERTLATIPSK